MKLIITALIAFTYSFNLVAQNVGIGTTTPTAMLEVVGNVKIVDGTQGVNKVLTSDATGAASWTSIGSQYGYKKCKQIVAAGNGSFTVPTGVTEIMVEAWGGGSGASCGTIANSFGGTSGGYVRTVQTVLPGAVLTYTVGAGSADGASNVNIASGGTTTFNFATGNIQAFGGNGHSANTLSVGRPLSGTGTVDNFVALYGNTGSFPEYTFGQKSATIFTQTIQWSSGGKAVGLVYASAQKGTLFYYENGVLVNSYYESFQANNFPSVGAFSSTTNVNGGGDGMLLIWYN